MCVIKIIIRGLFDSSDFLLFFSEISVGNTNAFKDEGRRARSGHFNGIANINIRIQNLRGHDCRSPLNKSQINVVSMPLHGRGMFSRRRINIDRKRDFPDFLFAILLRNRSDSAKSLPVHRSRSPGEAFRRLQPNNVLVA